MHCYATAGCPTSLTHRCSRPAGAQLVAAFWCRCIARCTSTSLQFIHIKVLYKYVHSLHHRNTDIEPFAGLCMHPIEHLYYFSCVAPSLYIFASPFAFMWNRVHLLISPAASHSGYEDNMQSDQFHYLHHRFFGSVHHALRSFAHTLR